MESSINQQHPADDAESFFGEQQQSVQVTAETLGPEQEDHFLDPEEQQEDPTPAEPDSTTGSTTEGQPAPAAAPPAEQAQEAQEGPKQSGPLTRGYVVLHDLPLTKRVLEHLLKELEGGERGGEPRHAYFELHHVQDARNATQAVSTAYGLHKERLGAEADVIVVTEKAFQRRRIQPRQRVQNDIAIVVAP